MLEHGERLVATLRKPEALDDLRARYLEDQLLIVKLDVTDPAQIKDAFRQATDAFGRVDVVFNNAGSNILAEAEGTTDEAARSLFEANFWGTANVSKEAVRVFREVNKPVGGRILNSGSHNGTVAMPTVSYYSASKFGEQFLCSSRWWRIDACAALEGFSASLAQELDPAWNIKVSISSCP